MRNSYHLMVIALASLTLSACYETPKSSPKQDVLKVVEDEPGSNNAVANATLITAPEPGTAQAASSVVVSPPPAETPQPVVIPQPTVEPESAVETDKGGLGDTECKPNGVSTTYFSLGGNDAQVTFVRADYIVVLSHVTVHATNGATYGGEVEIILPSQGRVYNITKDNDLMPRDALGSFKYMEALTAIALNQRYLKCAAENPSAFWRPKTIPEPPPLPAITLP